MTGCRRWPAHGRHLITRDGRGRTPASAARAVALLPILLSLPLGLDARMHQTAGGRAVEGYWSGVMSQQGADLDIDVVFSMDGGRLTGTWSAPSMRAVDVPLSALELSATRVTFELRGDQSTTVFTGTLAGARIEGTFQGGEGEGRFRLTRTAVPEPRFSAEEVEFTNETIRLAGTLLLPLAAGPHPAVLFLHGSGAEGRHGSRYLAGYLAERGIAALIFDKRGVGGSTGDWRQATLQDLAADALAGIRLLRSRPGIDAGAIGVYGHSQGGLIAPLVAAGHPEVAFLVAAASHGGPVFEQDLYRVQGALSQSSLSEDDRARAWTFYQRFVEVARTGDGIDALLADGAPLRGQPWFDWLEIPPRDHWLWRFYPPVGSFDPRPIWSRVTVPVLLLYGERDRIVPVSEGARRIGEALSRGGNHRWTAAILPRAAHDLTISPAPDEPFAWRQVVPGLGDLVAGWVLLQARGSARRADAPPGP